MRLIYRSIRRAMMAVFVASLVAGTGYYLVLTAGGIVSEIELRSKLRDRSDMMAQTATVLVPTVREESLALAYVTDTPTDIPPTATATESPVPPSATFTEIPPSSTATNSPTATETDTVTPEPTDTLSPPTDTLVPTDNPSATPVPATNTATSVPTERRAPLTSTPTQRPTQTAVENTSTPTEVPSTTPLSATGTFTPTLVPTEQAQVATLIPTNTVRATPFPTNTLRPTPTFTPSITLTPSITFTPSVTPTPSRTPTPSPSPYPIEGTYATPVTTPIIEFPRRAPLVENDPDIVNVLVMGSDTRSGNIGQTDVIILVSVHKEAGTVAMWHLPRDLLVYIPGYTVDRINRAAAVGAQMEFPGGGPGLVKETVLYNFGIEIDYFARVDFNDFEAIISRLGGLNISVDCEITDWALKSPELDPTVEDNWERYTMGVGYRHLTPYYALWYARSRVTTSDLDRGRRQIDVLRAIWRQMRQEGLLTQATSLWPDLIELVETDMELTDLLEFIPLADSLEINRIERFNGIIGTHYQNYLTPDDGRSVLLPVWEELHALAQDFVTPPTENRLRRGQITVFVKDTTAYGIGFEYVAADRLAWEGFAVIPEAYDGGSIREVSLIYDYTGETRSGTLERITQVMRAGQSQIIIEPDPNRTVDYRIEVGRNYNPCLYGSSAIPIDDGPPVTEGAPEVDE